MGIGDWGLGIGDWGLGPIPNPQSRIPNPQSPHKKNFSKKNFLKLNKLINYNTIHKQNLYAFKKINN
jgi:hypothetical protein